MPDELLIRHCSPTLAGLKTGSLFSCAFASQEEATQDIRRLNKLLVPNGLRVLPLRYSENRALIYVFRPSGLANDLEDGEARRILASLGYRSRSADGCIMELIQRLRRQEAFPHEIGLFLSYPPEDVNGFIRNKGRRCKCVGCWKVYGDETAARERFELYRKCTDVYSRQWAKGYSVEQLTIEQHRK